MERWWFQINFAGDDVPMLYHSDEDPDQVFEFSSADFTDDLAVWRRACDRSREIAAAHPSATKGAGFATGNPSRCGACWSR